MDTKAVYELAVKYESARLNYGSALAETMKTADGYPFEFNNSYYRPYCHGENSGVEFLDFYSWSLRYELDAWNKEGGGLTMAEVRSGEKLRRWNISDLYRKETNAQNKLLEMLNERRNWLDDSIAELESDLGGGGDSNML